MSKKISVTTQPTAPSVPFTLGGTEYQLCFDYAALSQAEQDMRKSGLEVNILLALGELNLTSIPILVTAAAKKYQPNVTLDGVKAQIHMGNVYACANAIQEAWAKSIPEPEKSTDPQKPEE